MLRHRKLAGRKMFGRIVVEKMISPQAAACLTLSLLVKSAKQFLRTGKP
jgi:hypothetical protein